MSSLKLLMPCFVLVCLIATSCTTEKKPDLAEMVIGKWEIESGYRNGKKANSLDGLYFEFKNDGKMVTNLLGSEQESNYEIKEGKLFQTSTETIEYTINEIAENKLSLSMNMRGFDFKLDMKKEAADEAD